MFSAEISAEEIASPALSELLGEFSEVKSASLSASKELFSLLYPYVKDEIRMTKDGDIGATHLSELPGDFYGIFERLISVCEEEINTNVKAKDEERGARLKLLRDYYYKVKRMYDTALAFDSDYRLFIFYEHAELRIKLYCVDTGRRISDRIAKGRSAVFFSATLAPLEYYKATLGADGTSDYIEVDSPSLPSSSRLP
jgi:Rad3-related DNA helicase